MITYTLPPETIAYISHTIAESFDCVGKSRTSDFCINNTYLTITAYCDGAIYESGDGITTELQARIEGVTVSITDIEWYDEIGNELKMAENDINEIERLTTKRLQ